ncbi:MAG: NAD(P)-dependent oxidoreductase [Acidimicrobiia bacterium]
MSSSAADATANQEITVGFIGVGQMGRPMVDRLLAAGWPTTAFVRRSEQRAELESDGIAVASSAVELAANVEVLILCLFNDAQFREVVLDGGVLDALRPGSVLVSHVTGSPALSVDLQAAAPEGVHVLDVPISGTADHIRASQLTLLVGGDRDALARVRPVLESYGNPILEVGGLGDGQRMKLINNLLFTVHLRTALAAASLGASMGVSPGELSRVVSECSGDSFALRLFQQIPPEAMSAAAKPYLVKDVGVIREVAASLGIDLGLLGDLASWVEGD